LQNLVARPSISSRWPASGDGVRINPDGASNVPTSPDRGGNPGLRPELATGIDIAVERYLKDGGVLSANLFLRRIKDYMRSQTALEDVSWSAQPRYVSRPQNVGRASTEGLELEAKFRLDQAVAAAPPVEVRSNLSLFRSRVEQVPGPDNRLDQQPRGTANLGADYRFRGLPLTLGGSLNWTPAYRTRISDVQAAEVSAKRQFDAYALWVFGPSAQLRLLASNLAAADYISASILDADGSRERAGTTAETYVNWQLRLELKL
jgi:iron complex outermembrane receptor protein